MTESTPVSYYCSNVLKIVDDICNHSQKMWQRKKNEAHKRFIGEAKRIVEVSEKNKPLLDQMNQLKESVLEQEKELSPIEPTTLESLNKPSLEELIEFIFGKEPDFNIESLQNKMTFIIDELYETEKNYISNLKLLITEYGEPSKQILDDQNHKTLFHGVQAVFECNSTLYHDKLLSVQTTDPFERARLISEAFSAFKERFTDVYSLYVAEYSQHLELIEKLKENNQFAELLKTTQEKLAESGCKNHSIAGLFITPVQRMPRYRLLFSDLLKKTPPSESSLREQVLCALNDISHVAEASNEKAREKDNAIKATQLQHFLKCDFRGRQYLGEFTSVRWTYLRKRGGSHVGTVHLLQDALLFVKDKQPRKYHVSYFNRQIIQVAPSNVTQARCVCADAQEDLELEFISRLYRNNFIESVSKRIESSAKEDEFPSIENETRNYRKSIPGGINQLVFSSFRKLRS